MTPAGAAADWRRRLDAFGARAMTVVGDWIAPSPRPGPSDRHVKALVTAVVLIVNHARGHRAVWRSPRLPT